MSGNDVSSAIAASGNKGSTRHSLLLKPTPASGFLATTIHPVQYLPWGGMVERLAEPFGPS